MVTFAFGSKNDRIVSLWCEEIDRTDDGCFEFEVINGGWRGMYDPEDGTMRVRQNGKYQPPVPAEIVWRGNAGFGYDAYNEAIAWIEEQLKKAD